MKQLLTLLLAALCATGMAQGAVGDTFTAGGIEYKITSETPAEVEVGLNAGFARNKRRYSRFSSEWPVLLMPLRQWGAMHLRINLHLLP